MHRGSGTAERARERIELDRIWREEFDRPDSKGVRRIDDVDSLNADIPTEVIGRHDIPETSVTELTSAEKKKHQQLPDDEAATLHKKKEAAEDKKPRMRNDGREERTKAAKKQEPGKEKNRSKGNSIPESSWNQVR